MERRNFTKTFTELRKLEVMIQVRLDQDYVSKIYSGHGLEPSNIYMAKAALLPS